jgi:hypothetical protein
VPLILTIRNVTELSNGSPTRQMLDRRGLMIGRAATVDWVLPDPRLHISSRHCEVRFIGDRYELVDHSTNGTFLMGEGSRLAAPRVIDQGDVFLIGDYEIEASLDEEAAARLAAERSAAAVQPREWQGWNAAGGGEPQAPPPPAAGAWGAPGGAAPPPSDTGGSNGWGTAESIDPAQGAAGWASAPAADPGGAAGASTGGWGSASAPAGGGGGWGAPPPPAQAPAPTPAGGGWSAGPVATPQPSGSGASGWGAPAPSTPSPPSATPPPAASGWGAPASSGGGGNWAPAAKPVDSTPVASPWNVGPKEQATPASGWSSPVSGAPPAESNDVWGKIAQSNVVDWARGGFGKATPAAPASSGPPGASVASAHFAPQPVVPSAGTGAPPSAMTQPPGAIPGSAAPPAAAAAPAPAPPSGAAIGALAAAAGVDPAKLKQGEADTVAMIYAVCPRTSGRVYGGTEFIGSGDNGTPDSYYYHLPWGFSSQAAHWSLMFSHYAAVHGATEQDLGHVAIQVREHAALNPAATMRKRLTMEDYLASRYIVAPLRLYDICLVNDGAVCVIVRKAELAKAMTKPPVLVAGWGAAKIRHSKLHAMVRERLRLQMEDAGGQALAMAGRTLDDIGHFEAYDAASMHLINQVEGYGFVPPGQGFAFCRDGQMTLGGRLPSNMGGGNLSGAYLQGWSQVAEVVRQLRGEAGERQVTSRRAAMSSLAQTDQAHPVIYELGE